MNIFLWILQVLMALHTAMGALWKFSNTPEQTMPSLRAIPNGLWLMMGGVEILIGLCFVLPLFYKPLAITAPVAAICVAIEMLVFIVLHFSSGDTASGPVIYWSVVALICAFIAFGRIALVPMRG